MSTGKLFVMDTIVDEKKRDLNHYELEVLLEKLLNSPMLPVIVKELQKYVDEDRKNNTFNSQESGLENA